jgi:hypothetical protein
MGDGLDDFIDEFPPGGLYMFAPERVAFEILRRRSGPEYRREPKLEILAGTTAVPGV